MNGTVGSGNPTSVKLYKNTGCTGAPAATGTVAQFTGAGIEVTVSEDRTTDLSARATDALGTDSAWSGLLT